MSIHMFNGFTCNTRRPFKLKTGMVCLLVETDQGLVLVDTGPGTADYTRPHYMLKIFRVLMDVPFYPQEAAVNQVKRLGWQPEDIRHIILTHMLFDHCGGLPDFPQAKVHVHQREYEAFTRKRHSWKDLAYIQRHIAQVSDWALYSGANGKWYDFDAIRLPFSPEMWLIPLHGHSWGHCGVAIKTGQGWFFNAGDAGAVYNNETPAWLIRFVLGPHDPCLRRFMCMHPEVVLSNSHMFPEWFENKVWQ